jgi:HTH-type transcriptional regulator/antitoxin HigA
MMLKPIRSEADYEANLSRLEALMDAAPGTPEGDELEILASLIERYEDERFPIEAPSPLAAIRFRMEQQDLSPRDLEPYIGSRARVSEVLSGARALSIDMIRALNQGLGIPAEILIRSDPVTQGKVANELSIPAAKRLQAWGLMDALETFDAFITRSLGGMPATAMLRKTRTERTNAKTDMVALQAWCAAALLRSQSVPVTGRFDKKRINLDLVRNLAKLSARDDGPQTVVDRLAGLGIAFVVLPHLPGTHLDGAAMLRSDGVPVIALTLRKDRIDNFWFTLLHELAHVKSHLVSGTQVIFDDLEIGSAQNIEQEADKMARVALIPDELWATFNSGTYTSMAELFDFARRAEVHPAIVAGRWQQRNRDFRKFSKLLGHGDVRQALAGQEFDA